VDGVVHEVTVDDDGTVRTRSGEVLHASAFTWLPPVTGTVVCAALNFRSHVDALGDLFRRPPHGEPPRTPVLFIKPANTLNAHWGRVQQPEGTEAIQPGPALAAVIGRTARRLAPEDVRHVIAGYTLFNDFSLPEDSYFRPPVRSKCIDSFGPLGPWVVPQERLGDPGKVGLRTLVDGEVRQEGSTEELIFDIPRLLASITEFMTLRAGDVVVTGFPGGRVGVTAGMTVSVEADGIGRLTNPVVSAAEFEAGRA